MTELTGWLARVNTCSEAELVAELGDLFEHSPWVVAAGAASRPFATARALHLAMLGAVRKSGREQQLTLIRAHPELAGREVVAGALTAASASEQSRLGLTNLSRADFEQLGELNRSYRERFAMPCIIALRRHGNLASVLAAFESRLGRSHDDEVAAALDEIAYITEGRLESKLGLSGGRLSTHVIDTACGLPAGNMAYELSVHRAGGWVSLLSGRTNEQGRTDKPLRTGLDMEAATYRIAFRAGDYFRANNAFPLDPGSLTGSSAAQQQPAFLEVIPIEFAIAEPGQHYHVPLLCSPWSYSTYCGSWASSARDDVA